MTNYRTSNGDWSLGTICTPHWRVRVLVSSIRKSLERGSLDWNDDKAWKDLEASYRNIKSGDSHGIGV